MVFKNEIFPRKAKKSLEISVVEVSNVPEMKKPPEISAVEAPDACVWAFFNPIFLDFSLFLLYVS